jgi:hypothetical protein
LSVKAEEIMARPVTYSIVDCPDGRFAVMAIAASGAVHLRGGLMTLADADMCVETLRVLMEACGAALVYCETCWPGPDHIRTTLAFHQRHL